MMSTQPDEGGTSRQAKKASPTRGAPIEKDKICLNQNLNILIK